VFVKDDTRGCPVARYEWTERYSVSIPEIDEQHQQLFALMNQAADAVENLNCAKAVTVLLPKLVDYTDYHFKTEEQKMSDHAYPAADIHRAQHDAFRERLNEMATRAAGADEGERAALMLELTNLVHNWLVNHIGTVDRELAEHVSRKG